MSGRISVKIESKIATLRNTPSCPHPIHTELKMIAFWILGLTPSLKWDSLRISSSQHERRRHTNAAEQQPTCQGRESRKQRNKTFNFGPWVPRTVLWTASTTRKNFGTCLGHDQENKKIDHNLTPGMTPPNTSVGKMQKKGFAIWWFTSDKFEMTQLRCSAQKKRNWDWGLSLWKVEPKKNCDGQRAVREKNIARRRQDSNLRGRTQMISNQSP